MLVRLDATDTRPLYLQIAAQLRRVIVERKVEANERLPAARELAQALEVNMHTVLKAYDELRQEGLVEMRRGRGVVVVGDAQPRARLLELARELLDEGRRQGLALKEVKQLLEQLV